MGLYVPRQGDFIVVTFDPQAGHEQKGRRPALVVSKDVFNRSGFAIICPATNTDRDYPFHVKIEGSATLTGYIMVEQVKSLDYRARKIRLIERASPALVTEVLAILDSCIYDPPK